MRRVRALRLDQRVDRLLPVAHAVAGRRIRVAAAQDGAQEIALDVVLVLELAELGLSHLAELLVERHLREQRPHAGVERRKPRRRGRMCAAECKGERRRGAERGQEIPASHHVPRAIRRCRHHAGRRAVCRKLAGDAP